MILIVVAIATAGLFVFKQYGGSNNTVRSATIFPEEIPHAEPEQVIAKPEPAANTVPHGDTWCFVGEDVQGRWCIQVPSKLACDSNRSFPSEQDCKLVAASPMPLGVATRGDSLMQPIGPIPAMSNTY